LKKHKIYLFKSSFECRVCIGFRSDGFMRIGEEGFEIGATNRALTLNGFGKVDGVDSIEEMMQ
jgi:hypothetical protein